MAELSETPSPCYLRCLEPVLNYMAIFGFPVQRDFAVYSAEPEQNPSECIPQRKSTPTQNNTSCRIPSRKERNSDQDRPKLRALCSREVIWRRFRKWWYKAAPWCVSVCLVFHAARPLYAFTDMDSFFYYWAVMIMIQLVSFHQVAQFVLLYFSLRRHFRKLCVTWTRHVTRFRHGQHSKCGSLRTGSRVLVWCLVVTSLCYFIIVLYYFYVSPDWWPFLAPLNRLPGHWFLLAPLQHVVCLAIGQNANYIHTFFFTLLSRLIRNEFQRVKRDLHTLLPRDDQEFDSEDTTSSEMTSLESGTREGRRRRQLLTDGRMISLDKKENDSARLFDETENATERKVWASAASSQAFLDDVKETEKISNDDADDTMNTAKMTQTRQKEKPKPARSMKCIRRNLQGRPTHQITAVNVGAPTPKSDNLEARNFRSGSKGKTADSSNVAAAQSTNRRQAKLVKSGDRAETVLIGSNQTSVPGCAPFSGHSNRQEIKRLVSTGRECRDADEATKQPKPSVSFATFSQSADTVNIAFKETCEDITVKNNDDATAEKKCAIRHDDMRLRNKFDLIRHNDGTSAKKTAVLHQNNATLETLDVKLHEVHDLTLENKFDVLRREHESLCRLLHVAQQCLEHFLAANFAVTIPLMCVIIFCLGSGPLQGSELGILLMLAAQSVVIFSCVLATAISVQEAAASPLSVIYGADWSVIPCSLVTKLQLFATRFGDRDLGFHVYGFFTVTRETVLLIVGTFITYAVVVIQFQMASPVTSCTPNNTLGLSSENSTIVPAG